MGKKEDKKRLLAQVEETKQEYLHTCDVADECYGRLDHQREEAISTMEQSEGLINSIKHTPFSFKKDLKALSRERKKITDHSDLEKEQRAADRAAGIAAVMAIGAGGLGSLSFKDFLSDKFNVSDDDNGNNGIVYTATKSADYTRYFLDNIAVPGTTNTITIECSGVVKVGYEVEDIEIKVDNDSLKIYISLPEAQVFDNYVIWDTVRCPEENNILNPIDFEQYQGIISEIETEGLTLAEADGIYEDAEANMETIICNFLSGFEDYEIVFL